MGILYVFVISRTATESIIPMCPCNDEGKLCTSIQYKKRGTRFRQGIAKSIRIVCSLDNLRGTFQYRLDPWRYHSMTGVCIHAGGRHGPDVNRKSMKSDPANWFVHIPEQPQVQRQRPLHSPPPSASWPPTAINVLRIKATSAPRVVFHALRCLSRPLRSTSNVDCRLATCLGNLVIAAIVVEAAALPLASSVACTGPIRRGL